MYNNRGFSSSSCLFVPVTFFTAESIAVFTTLEDAFPATDVASFTIASATFFDVEVAPFNTASATL